MARVLYRFKRLYESSGVSVVAVRDVARRAGVSTTTVSHVINGTRFVSKELCERVRAAVQELDYQPNAAARALALKRTNTIGLIVSDIRDPFSASVARGVDDLAHERGYCRFCLRWTAANRHQL